ncbi:receptor-like protein kinase FERONIA [Gossypium australe]|uniref:Receptor-like protein kinase FERONIA n=1 Tax=Gossypium australe TaxID=47621 RepID=A0A5B6VAN7_9ROSI|nr:receptor-like protein kinase FERONIA [Gossypium australe]
MDEDNSIPLILGRPFLATANTKIDVAIGELILRVGDESINLQALNSARKIVDEGKKVTSIDNQIVQTSSQETTQGKKPEPIHRPKINKEESYEERSLRVDKLEEWKTKLKEELEPHEVKPKEPLDELIGTTNHFKVGDQISRPHGPTHGRARGRVEARG